MFIGWSSTIFSPDRKSSEKKDAKRGQLDYDHIYGYYMYNDL